MLNKLLCNLIIPYIFRIMNGPRAINCLHFYLTVVCILLRKKLSIYINFRSSEDVLMVLLLKSLWARSHFLFFFLLFIQLVRVQLTLEVEENNFLPFYDVLVSKHPDLFSTFSFRKPFAISLPPHAFLAIQMRKIMRAVHARTIVLQKIYNIKQ